jgi:hypothetical protein
MNLTESAYLLTPEECMREAGRQFAMAEVVGRHNWQGALYERGGWFLLLRWAEITYVAPYCAKLAGPCPDGCAGVAVLCGRPGELHGDCWRVKQPPAAGVAFSSSTDGVPVAPAMDSYIVAQRGPNPGAGALTPEDPAYGAKVVCKICGAIEVHGEAHAGSCTRGVPPSDGGQQ